jgi:hypothetical protein
MLAVINNHTYCRTVLITKNRVSSWLKRGTLSNVGYRDRRGWRLLNPTQTGIARTKTDLMSATNRSD